MTRHNTDVIRSGDEALSEALLGGCQHVSTQTLVQTMVKPVLHIPSC